MRAIDRHKQALRAKWNSGIGAFPFWVLWNWVIKSYYVDKAHDQAGLILSYAYRTRKYAEPGINDLLRIFEYEYEKKPRLTLQALQVLLECPPDPKYPAYLEQKRKERLEYIKGINLG
jgi:hypothetical protein